MPSDDDRYGCLAPLAPIVIVLIKNESTIGPGKGGTSYLSDSHQTLPV